MPSSRLSEFIRRLSAVESKMEQHLLESVAVHTNIGELQTSVKWLTKAFWVIAGAGVTGSVSLLILLFKQFIER